MIEVIDRKSGELFKENVYGQSALRFLYGSHPFTKLLQYLACKSPLLSRIYGYLMSRPSSAKKVLPFIERFHIDTTEFAASSFSSFNDFFTRKINPRPLAASPFIIPADGRYLFYEKSSEFSVKGSCFTLEEFLQSGELAKNYLGGPLFLARLCPVDYHRFHFPFDCIPKPASLINGYLYSVNPIALKQNLNILAQNKRYLISLDTPLGKVLAVLIGATNVGSIHTSYTANQPAKKGEEMGYFSFGGSALAFLFPAGSITFDPDLIKNTKKGYETYCKFGQSLL